VIDEDVIDGQEGNTILPVLGKTHPPPLTTAQGYVGLFVLQYYQAERGSLTATPFRPVLAGPNTVVNPLH